MRRSFVVIGLILLIALSGCISFEVEADLHRDKSMDIRLGVTSDYDRATASLREDMKESYGNETGKLVNTSDGVFYEWKNVRPPIVKGESDDGRQLGFLSDSLNISSDYAFPFSYTYELQFASEGLDMPNGSAKMDGMMAEQLADSIDFTFTLDPFGEIVETNGELTGDGAVRFDMTQDKEYVVRISDSLWNQVGVDEACQEVYECSEWSSCTEGQKERTCEAVNKCDTYMYRPDEVKQCGSNSSVSLGGAQGGLSGSGSITGNRRGPDR